MRKKKSNESRLMDVLNEDLMMTMHGYDHDKDKREHEQYAIRIQERLDQNHAKVKKLKIRLYIACTFLGSEVSIYIEFDEKVKLN